MEEAFLHFLWKYRLLSGTLKTTEGEEILIENPGLHNHDSGPDFLTAKIRIGGTLWAGNVEIHTLASDWIKHKHQHDKNYANIILHVIYDNDKNLNLNSPALEIKNHINPDMYEKYLELINNKNWVPCAKLASGVDHFIWQQWKNRLLVERLEKKFNEIKTLLIKYQNSWEEVFYVQIARNFGLKVNSGPFELLAKSLPLKTLARHKQSLLQTEALLFGQAGLLEESFSDAYPKTLQKEYKHLRHKYHLQPVDANLWRFLRLRPANFPHIRIAQFAQLIHKSTSLFSYVIESAALGDIRNLFIIKASDYWKTHYRFDKTTQPKDKFLGNTAINLIMINTVAPFLFAYGKEKGNETLRERALHYLTEFHPNIITSSPNGKKPAFMPGALSRLKR